MAQFDLKLLQSFCVFAESDNLVEAAGKLGISQPALSAHLQELEARLPQKPFVQKGRRKALTRFGEDLYQALKDRFSNIEQVVESVSKRHLAPDEITLRVCGAKEILSRMARTTHDLQFAFEFIDCRDDEAAQILGRDGADFAVTSKVPDSLRFMAKPLFDDSFKIVAPKKWELKSERFSKVLMQELAERPFLAYEKGEALTAPLFERSGLDLRPRSHRLFRDWPTLLSLAESQAGWSVVPSSYLSDSTKYRVIDLPQDLSAKNQFHLLFNKTDYQMRWFHDLVGQILTRY